MCSSNVSVESIDFDSLTDDKLVALYEGGNDEAFDKLLDRYETSVFTYILRYVHVREVAEDVFQEVFMRVVTHIKNHKYNYEGKFVQWLMRITRNKTLDTIRHGKCTDTMSMDDDENGIGSEYDNGLYDSHEQEIIDQQILHEVNLMIERLPESQRQVVIMRFYDELSFKEIADTTNVSVNTALGRMHYALGNLRKIANTYGIHMAG